MIVVEILAIVAAIAVPNYIRTRIQANEASAVASLRVILDAQINYNAQNYVYASDIALLTNANPPYLEGGDWTSAKNGFNFRVEGGAIEFVAYATPVEFNTTGWHGYRIDHQGAIRFEVGQEPNENSPVINGT